MNLMNFLAMFRQLKAVPASAVAERIHEEYELESFPNNKFLRTASIEQTVTLTAAASVNLTTQVPANARILFASIKLSGAMVLVTAVKLGVGVAGTPSAFLLSTVTMADATKADQVVADQAAARTTAPTTIVLSTTDAAGAAAGTGTGVVKVRVVYQYCQTYA